MDDINETPTIYVEKCAGCGVCISACPGLACFVIDETYSDDQIAIKIPYEMSPLPEKGAVVDALDRFGNVVGKANVINVQAIKKFDKTNIITITVPNDLIYDVRSIKVGR
jgi:Fe-S-cluster-containing hydrogenase component 2